MYGNSFDGCAGIAAILLALAAIGLIALVLAIAWLVAHIDVSWVS